jgi:hypothetical protein
VKVSGRCLALAAHDLTSHSHLSATLSGEGDSAARLTDVSGALGHYQRIVPTDRFWNINARISWRTRISGLGQMNAMPRSPITGENG